MPGFRICGCLQSGEKEADAAQPGGGGDDGSAASPTGRKFNGSSNHVAPAELTVMQLVFFTSPRSVQLLLVIFRSITVFWDFRKILFLVHQAFISRSMSQRFCWTIILGSVYLILYRVDLPEALYLRLGCFYSYMCRTH